MTGMTFKFGRNCAALLLAAGGCANIIGVSDLENDDPTGAVIGGRGGNGGSGGGSSGSSGSTGKGGSGGGDAECGDTLELNDAIVQGCLLYESCFTPTNSISSCVTFNVPNAFQGYSCAQTAQSCSDIVECRHGGFFHPDAPADCAGSTTDSCADNIALNCSFDVPSYTDCTLEGGECDDSSGFALCRVLDTCAEADFEGGCDGNNSYFCYGGVGYGFDCTTIAATCNSDDGTCYYAQTACGADSFTCVGDTSEECVGGWQTTYDCGEVNLGCAEASGTTYCLAPGCTVSDWNNCQESCSGTELTFCYGGAEVTVDCVDYGFTTCSETELEFGDGSTAPIAVCAF